ncbi:MAG: fasciclin domain-containing protein, partial [Anaerolineae bacterium]|nr:fasciclin domain-containing protein [Anaerolineae bacterium]
VIEGEVLAADVAAMDGEDVETLSGDPITITVNEDGTVMLNDTVEVIETDIMGSNGVIHIVDGVLLPPMEDE